jgi:hypothetical protein
MPKLHGVSLIDPFYVISLALNVNWIFPCPNYMCPSTGFFGSQKGAKNRERRAKLKPLLTKKRRLKRTGYLGMQDVNGYPLIAVYFRPFGRTL